jgi:serine/threonine protein kinase
MSTFEWNNYIITKEAIGKGAYAKVYYGYHKHTKRDIALKKILFTKLPANVKDKVISEIHILQSMTHHQNGIHIMELYEYRFDGDYLVLVTEYCNQGDLEKWLKQDHDFKERADIMVQIMRGMDYLHQHNILHRDIKPKNILLHDGIIKICDFGFSTMIKEYNQLFNTICGTPLYMSPELLFMQPYTLKSDIWALGILFYTILYKCHPYGKLINMEDYRLKIKFPIYYPNCDAYGNYSNYGNYVNVIKQMLSYQPEHRPDATMILKALEGNNENESIEWIELQHGLNYEVTEILESEKKVEIGLEKVEVETELPTDKDKRIIELEEHVFKLETMIKERDNTYISCCFTSDETDDVTGRGRTNRGYEKDYQNVDMEYFTPPTSSIPINIPKKSHSLSSTPSDSSSKGSLSSSFGTFFNMLTKSFSK